MLVRAIRIVVLAGGTLGLVTAGCGDGDDNGTRRGNGGSGGNRAPVITSFDIDDVILEMGVETATVTVEATDPDGDELTYTWEVDDVVDDSATGPSFAFAPPALGEFAIDLEVSDGKGEAFRAGVTVLAVDTTAPTVEITAPSDTSIVMTTLTITSTATDRVEVAGVEVRIDDGTWQSATAGTAPEWTLDLNTRIYDNGLHTITVRATDGLGNEGEASIDVTVSNTWSIPLEIGVASALSWRETPSLALDTSGNPHVAWFDRSGGTAGLHTGSDDHGTSFSTPDSLGFGAAHTTGNAGSLTWVAGQGPAYFTHFAETTGDPELVGTRIDTLASMTSFTAFARANVQEYTICADTDGGLHVVWVENPSAYYLYHRRWTGTEWEDIHEISQRVEQTGVPRCAARPGSASDLHVIWVDDRDQIRHTASADGGATWSDTQQTVSQGHGYNIHDSAVPFVVNAENDFYAIWQDHSSNNLLYLSTNAGTPEVVPLAGYKPYDPGLALDADGNLYVIWRAQVDDTALSDNIFLMVQSAGKWLPRQQITDYDDADNVRLRFADVVVGDGPVHALWVVDDTQDKVYYARLP